MSHSSCPPRDLRLRSNRSAPPIHDFPSSHPFRYVAHPTSIDHIKFSLTRKAGRPACPRAKFTRVERLSSVLLRAGSSWLAVAISEVTPIFRLPDAFVRFTRRLDPFRRVRKGNHHGKSVCVTTVSDAGGAFGTASNGPPAHLFDRRRRQALRRDDQGHSVTRRFRTVGLARLAWSREVLAHRP